jgi:hypothetical protein
MTRHETPIKRVNPSGKTVWVARYTNRHGQRKSAGTYRLEREAQRAIDVAYAAESSPRGELCNALQSLGGYAALWPKVHPRSERTNTERVWRLSVVLEMKVEGRELRHWPLHEIRRRHALEIQNQLLEQGRSAAGVTGILRALSALTNDAIDDELTDSNPWLRLGVRATDPRVQKPAREVRVWTFEQMHAFAAAAGPYEAQIRLLSDCGLRLGGATTPRAPRRLRRHYSRRAHSARRARYRWHEDHARHGRGQRRTAAAFPGCDVEGAAAKARHAAVVPDAGGLGLDGAQLAPQRVGADAQGDRDGPAAARVSAQLRVADAR